MENQLDILSESLDKKLHVLMEIQEYNLRQEQAFKAEQVDMESFDAAIEEKETLIQKVLALDEGFEALYASVAEELKTSRERYRDKIKLLQDKIAKVTELSVAIQAQEARNKKLVEDYFTRSKGGIKKNRQSAKAAYGYYRNMSGANIPQPGSWDSKQ